MKPEWLQRIIERAEKYRKRVPSTHFGEVSKDREALLSALNKAYEALEKAPCKCLKEPVYSEFTGEPYPLYTCARCEALSFNPMEVINE